MTWKSIHLIHNPKNLSPHWNYQVFDIFSPFLLVLNHICQSRIKVACKVAKSFLTLFPVTLVKVEVQERSLHQMNHKKVYFLTCFMQNVQKLNMVGYRALNDRADHYGPPCIAVLRKTLWKGMLLQSMREESHSNVTSVNILAQENLTWNNMLH